MTIKLVGFQRLGNNPISVTRVLGFDAMTGVIRWLGSEGDPSQVVDLSEFRRLEAHKEVIPLVGPSPELAFNTEDIRAICVRAFVNVDSRLTALLDSIIDVSAFRYIEYEYCWVLFEPVNAAQARIQGWLTRLCDRIDLELEAVDIDTAFGRQFVDRLWDLLDRASWLVTAGHNSYDHNTRFLQTKQRLIDLDDKAYCRKLSDAEEDRLLQQEKQQQEHLQVFQKQFLSLLDVRIDTLG